MKKKKMHQNVLKIRIENDVVVVVIRMILFEDSKLIRPQLSQM